jgi:hypothetical protein
MADEYFVGLRATGDLATNERPESWRAGILDLFPNGMAPLTALTALMPSEKVTDPHYHWWTKTLTTQRAAVTGIYDDALLSVAVDDASPSGATRYVKIAEADSKMFRPGHQVLLRLTTDYSVDVVAKVDAVVQNGASSYLTVTLLEADDNSTANGLSSADVVLIIGNMNPMGGNRPEAIAQSPTEFENYTQIFRNSLDLSRTLMETTLRTEDAYQSSKKDALEQHSIEMEKAFLWGINSTGTGSNGKPEYSTRGIISFIKEHGTVQDYVSDTAAAYAGKTWLQAGEQWLDEHFEEMFRYGGTERLALCGSGALLGIQRLVKNTASYNLALREAAYGIQVVEWVTPFGSIMLKTHPLMSYEVTNRHSMVLIEPRNLKFKYITDTKFKPDNSDNEGGGSGVDGKQEEWLTEGGLEIHHPITTGFLNGVGQDNTVT